jgi:hypothetical protein
VILAANRISGRCSSVSPLQGLGCLRGDVVEHHVLAVSVFFQRVKRFVGFSSDVEWLLMGLSTFGICDQTFFCCCYDLGFHKFAHRAASMSQISTT